MLSGRRRSRSERRVNKHAVRRAIPESGHSVEGVSGADVEASGDPRRWFGCKHVGGGVARDQDLSRARYCTQLADHIPSGHEPGKPSSSPVMLHVPWIIAADVLS